MKCLECGREPKDILEYVEAALDEKMTPDDYVRREEGTYNPILDVFWCTECYIQIGMPLGKARKNIGDLSEE